MQLLHIIVFMVQQLVDIKIKNIMNINEITFPAVQEGDKILWEDGNYYVYTNETWVLEEK